MSETTFDVVLDYVAQHATREEIHALFNTGNARLKMLHAAEAASTAARLTEGATVELQGLKPKYLNGIRGTFVRMLPGGKAAAVQLSTEDAFLAGRYVAADNQLHAPLSALRIVS